MCRYTSLFWSDNVFVSDECIALGSGNSVGAIPSISNGGLTALQIVPARIITAADGLVPVSETENSDMLYALKVAGQYFGLVTKLTANVHPLTILNTPNNTIWAGTMVFSPSRANEVFEAMIPILNRAADPLLSARAAGLLIFGCPPPTSQPAIMAAVQYIGSAEEGQAFYQPVIDLKPDFARFNEVPWEKMKDPIDIFCATGDYKRWGGTGLRKIDTDGLHFLLNQFLDVCEKVPDKVGGAYAVEWRGPTATYIFGCKSPVIGAHVF